MKRLCQVLERQHGELLLRLEKWLSKLEEQLPSREARDLDWAREVTPAVTNRLSGMSVRSARSSRNRTGTGDEEDIRREEKPQRRSIHSDDYELAQSEADRVESMKNMTMASRQTSKTKTKLQSWAKKIQQRSAKIANSLAFNIFFGVVPHLHCSFPLLPLKPSKFGDSFEQVSQPRDPSVFFLKVKGTFFGGPYDKDDLFKGTPIPSNRITIH